MHTQGAIDDLLQIGLELKLTDAYVTAEWRPRALKALQIAVVEICNFGDWWWLHTNTQLTWNGSNPAPHVIEAPTDFRRVGPKGGLYHVGYGKVEYVQPEVFLRKLRPADTSGQGTSPLIYSILGISANKRANIGIMPFPAPGQTTTLTLDYEKLKPTLTDANPGGLTDVPDDIAQNAVYIGALDWLLFGQGDGRALMEVSGRFASAVRGAWAATLPDLDGIQALGDEGISQEEMW